MQAVSRADVSRASRLPGDVIVFPAGQIGQLVERDLVRLLDDATLEDDKFDRRDIFDQVRLREMVWGQKAVAVPLGSPWPTLYWPSILMSEIVPRRIEAGM